MRRKTPDPVLELLCDIPLGWEPVPLAPLEHDHRAAFPDRPSLLRALAILESRGLCCVLRGELPVPTVGLCLTPRGVVRAHAYWTALYGDPATTIVQPH